MSEQAKPDAPVLELHLDRLTADEVQVLADISDAIAHKEHPVMLGPNREALERVGLKLQAQRKGGA
jgi:hypothetical protein